tara:strand:+ start:1210 stop:2898 length:1689 start_codon:yes stop_codon:yes gene_type:complete
MGALDDVLKQLNNKNTDKNKKNFNVGTGEGVLRAGLGQGIAFGFGDELEALYKSRTRGTEYEDEVADARAKIKRFRETNPTLAYGSEIGGALLPMALSGGASAIGQGLARAGARGTGAVLKGAGKGLNLLQTGGIRGAGKLGAVQGGLYGAGVGEDAESRLKGAVGGAVLGATIGKTAQKLLPKTTELANKFLRNNINLTGGQSVKGSGGLGNLIYGLESSSTSIPGVGSAIAQAKTKSLSEFNKYAMIEALEPILTNQSRKLLQKKLKNLNGTEAFRVVKETLDESYGKLIPKLKLDGADIVTLQHKFVDIIEASATDQKAKDMLVKRLTTLFDDKIQFNKAGERFISGENAKKLQSALGKEAQKFFKKGGFDDYVGEAFDGMKNALSTRLNLSPNAGNILKNVNLAFARLDPIKKAVVMANKTQGIFSTKQFLNAIKQADMSPNKTMTATGKGLMTKTAREGDEIFGDFLPDSGTASRLIAGDVAISPTALTRYFLPTIGSQILYGGSRGLTRQLLNAPSRAVESGQRAVSGLLGERTANMPIQGLQNIGDSGGLLNMFK